jgi:hypothetical protein
MVISLFIFILSVPGAFMVASRRMDFRRTGFACILSASLMQAALAATLGLPWLVASSLVFSTSAVVGLANNWTWRK